MASTQVSCGVSPAKFAVARRDFEAQWPSFLTLEVSAAVSREAGEFAERYALRGFDALHLASFAEIARRAGVADTRVSSFDAPLSKAARDVSRRLSTALQADLSPEEMEKAPIIRHSGRRQKRR